MKKFLFALAAIAVAIVGLGTHKVSADTDAAWDKPVATLGSSLTSSQQQGVINTLTSAAGTGSSYDTLTVNGSTLVKYLNPSGESFTSTSGVWSSAWCRKLVVAGLT